MRFSLRHDFGKFCIFIGLGAAVFTIISAVILILQHRIVSVTQETSHQIVPEIQMRFRVIRNLELLRNYGNVAYRTTDKKVRQEAGFLSTILTSHPTIGVDPITRSLFREADAKLQDIALNPEAASTWPEIEQKLAAHADRLTILAETMTSDRATRIASDATKIRDFISTQTVLFFISTAVMILFGRILLARVKERNQYFNELSHDFRQRVHNIEISFETASHAKPHAEMLRVQSLMTDLQRYLDNFLDIARMESVIVKPIPEQFELFGLFQKLALQVEDMADIRKVDLRFRYNNFNLFADERLLQRALENLIANALKFSKGKVLVAARRKGSNIQIMVVDNGNGIPEQVGKKSHRAMVFKSFSQGGNANKVPDHGFGLGLTIVKRMIDTLGAFLTINSVADRGTAICIELPAQT